MTGSTTFKPSEPCIYKLILPPSVAAGNVEDLETLRTGPCGTWGLKVVQKVKFYAGTHAHIFIKYIHNACGTTFIHTYTYM